MLTVDIKFTIYFCRLGTEFSIVNDLNLGFNRARHFYLLWIGSSLGVPYLEHE